MKKLIIAIGLSSALLSSVAAHAVDVTIDPSTTDINFTYSGSPTVLIANSATGTANYGGFVITNYSSTSAARVVASDGSTDTLTLTGLKITNNNSSTATLTITYSGLFNGTGDGFAGQQLAGAFSVVSSTNTVSAYAQTRPFCIESTCFGTPIDASPLRNPPGTLTAASTQSFGGTSLRETVSFLGCLSLCYYIEGSLTVQLLPGSFITLPGSHDIEIAQTLEQLIADFDAHLADEHGIVPEPSSLALLLSALGPMGYFIARANRARRRERDL